MTTYLRNTKFGFGKHRGMTLSEVWKVNQSYITNFIMEKVDNAYISQKTLNELRYPETIKLTKYCYKGYIDEFLSLDKSAWLAIMKSNYENNRGDFAEDSIVRSWSDCFDQLSVYLKRYRGKRYYLIFEYELELGSGRRPDVILLMDNDVVILEFKEKKVIERKDIIQLQDYTSNISGYHIASREKHITPILVETKLEYTVENPEDSNITICSPDSLYKIIDKLDGQEISYNPNIWIDSNYEPLPTIIKSARMIMEHKSLPQIKQAKSAGIPDALSLLKQVALRAELEKEYILAIVTGVPGAGKTLLGLQIAYEDYGAGNHVKSIFLSGNGPLIKVLQTALESKVFVNDLHAEINNFYNNNKPFNKNIVVFDEGQRAWDEERVGSKYPRLFGNSEPELVINMVEKNQEGWGVLVVLVGEGQEIHIGEEKGIKLWDKALNKCSQKWKVLCPDKIEGIFRGHRLIKSNNKNSLDLKVSLRSKLAGQVSNWVNEVLSANISKAKLMAKEIQGQNFKLLISRDLEEAKNYCYDKYEEIQDKRYGILASSKSQVLQNFGIDNSFYTTSKVNFGDWYNKPKGEEGSCCNLKTVVTEFGCQGLEVDLPILAWGEDMIWDGDSWKKYEKYQKGIYDPDKLRKNSYRVLMTRGRDGLIIFVPPVKELDSVYKVLHEAGMDEIR